LHILRWLIENGADLRIVNDAGESARDVARRFAQLASLKLLDTELGVEEELLHARDEEGNLNAEAKDGVMLTVQQKKEAMERARTRLNECERQLLIARSNYVQLGGKIDETMVSGYRSEQAKVK
jgi:ankyrin repeat domain-containing protein 42